MLFEDRVEAGEVLSLSLKKFLNRPLLKNFVIVSILKGGYIVGEVVAKNLGVENLPLVVTKITNPRQMEMAIGAHCFGLNYLDKDLIRLIKITPFVLKRQVTLAKKKFSEYIKFIGINQSFYKKSIDKIACLIDDGVATGASATAGLKFLRRIGFKIVVLASPIAPYDFKNPGFDSIICSHREFDFTSVSKYYNKFPQVDITEIKSLIFKKLIN